MEQQETITKAIKTIQAKAEGLDRYTLKFDEAKELCEALGTTLASVEQLTAAYDKGYESCRYGWVSNGNAAIPRQEPNSLCALNQTGVITIVPTDIDPYDAYCYNKSENNESQDLNHTMSPTSPSIPVTSVEIQTDSTVNDVTEPTHGIEKTDFSPINNQYTQDVSSTQPSITNTEREEEGLMTSTGSYIKNENAADQSNTSIVQDANGSGMGETTNIISNDSNNEDTRLEGHDTTAEDGFKTQTAETAVGEPVNEDHTKHSRGRMGPGQSTPPEEQNDSKSDWLVILLVVVVVVLLVLVAIAVATSNRWCGRRRTLIITTKSSIEGNGTAASTATPEAQEREQEMVTLMNKEKIQENGNTEEFTVIVLEESPEKNTQA
ncbi:CD44 antigen isoform X4 [Silurus meridionalis]|nr:CD44 antigen isoform X4 [Silurus meridionalis]